MFVIVTTILSILIAIIIAALAWLTYNTPPRFSRKILVYEHDESAPVINEKARGGASLTVTYGGTNVDDPHIVRFKLENVGRADVPSAAFDQAMPMQFDFGVKIVAVLHEAYHPTNVIAPNAVFTEKVLNIGPGLIPSGASMEYILLIDGSCNGMTARHALEGVDLNERSTENKRYRIPLRQLLTYATMTFAIYWVTAEPANAAHLVHNIGSFLSSTAQGLSNLIANL